MGMGIGLGIGIGIGGGSSFSPSAISNLALWLNGNGPAFTDTGNTTLASPPNGRARSVPQPAPLTGSWTASSAALSSFRETNSFDLQMSGPLRFSQPAGVTVPTNNCTLALSFELRAMGAGGASGGTKGVMSVMDLITGTDGSHIFGFRLNAGALQVLRNAGTLVVAPTIHSTDKVSVVIRCTATGIDYKVTINGVVTTGSEVVTLTGNVAGLVLGGSEATFFSQVAASQFVSYSRAVTDAERDALSAFMAANVPAEFPLSVPLIQVIGDSIPTGFGSSPLATWPFLMQQNLYGQTVPPRLFNTAVGASKLSDMATDYPTFCKPMFNASRVKSLLFVSGATNSMTDSLGLTAAQVLSQLYAICDTARADGYKVVLCTVLPREDAAAGAGFNAKRALVNPDIVANFASHADALCNFAGVSGMGADGDSSNATNYNADKLHPTAAGHILLEPTARAAALTLL